MVKKRTYLYLHSNPATKKWLIDLCKKQPGRVSQATMAEQIFVAARRLGLFDRSEKRKKNG